MKKRKNICLLLAFMLCCMLSISAVADTLHRVRIRQVYLFQDVLRVYADIEDINGNALESVKKTNAVGYLDQKRLTTSSVKKFSDTQEGVADVFLVDISKSLSDAQMQQVKAAMKKWASEMQPNDRMAILTFGEEVYTVLDYSNDLDAISEAIESIYNTDMETKLYGAVDEGLNLCMRSDADLPKRRNMVLVTDGQNDFNGGVSLDDVCEQLKKTRIPIYCLWLENSSDEGESTMNTLAETSGGEKYNLNSQNIDAVYDEVREDIQETFVIDFAYSDLELNGNSSNLELKVTADGKTPSDMIDAVFNAATEKSGLGEPDTAYLAQTDTEEDGKESDAQEETEEEDEENEEDEDDNKKIFVIVLGVGVLILIAGIVLIVIKLVKSRKSEEDYFDIDADNQNTLFIPREEKKPITQLVDENNRRYVTLKFLNTDTGEILTLVLTNKASIGRKAGNNLVLKSKKVSNRHCELYLEQNGVFLEDLGSTNGTKVNNCPVQEKTKIDTGDTITLADQTLELTIIR